ncbi:YgaP family membrane protein [Rubrivirga sp.]|uniref:YgaP family membrane protein n=1 Tax=Rubrivirga sp. TaxID=1885344 RepID=UPI003C7113F9
MTLNMGRTDRTFRLAAAAVLLLLVVFVTDGALDWVLGIVAVVFAATAFVGTCPAYLPFGLSTLRK